MNARDDRQESANAPRWTEQERARLAAMLPRQRRALGLKQSDVADRSGVAVRTIGNIERGERVPQADVLKRLLIALDLFDDAGSDFGVETRTWLSQVGRLVEMIPDGPRGSVMTETTARLGEAVARYSRPNVLAFPTEMSDPNENLSDEELEEGAMAAHTSSINEEFEEREGRL